MPSPTLLEQALGLPEQERFRLVEALLTSLSSIMEDEITGEQDKDNELSEELQRRGEELLANPDAAMSWDEVQSQAEAELKKLGKGPCL